MNLKLHNETCLNAEKVAKGLAFGGQRRLNYGERKRVCVRRRDREREREQKKRQ